MYREIQTKSKLTHRVCYETPRDAEVQPGERPKSIYKQHAVLIKLKMQVLVVIVLDGNGDW